MAPRYPAALRSLRAIWIDAGTADEFYLDLGATAFRAALADVGVADDRGPLRAVRRDPCGDRVSLPAVAGLALASRWRRELPVNDRGLAYVLKGVGAGDRKPDRMERLTCVTDGGQRPRCRGPVALLAACGSSGTSSGASGGSTSSTPAASPSSASAAKASTSAAGIKTTSTGKGTVLTTAQGFTIYWFAIDTPTKSNCNGQCTSFWPPLTGTPSMASGASLTGKFGTIKRADGTEQATYEGHPLYLFAGDKAAGR